jgi:hypothetical protein
MRRATVPTCKWKRGARSSQGLFLEFSDTVSFLNHQTTGYHDPYAKGTPGGFDQATRAQDGATIGDTSVLSTASPMGGSQKLRNINLLLQKRSDILSNEMRVFFCKYNDPLYVKVEKLDIMVRLASENNVDALLSELKE